MKYALAGLAVIVMVQGAAGLEGTVVGWGSQVVVGADELRDGVAIDAGGQHSLVLNADGSVVAWGFNDWGQCELPVVNERFTAVAAGMESSLGLRDDGTIERWGSA